tara:strand:+ start:33 stop:515 length:483 start_codon:yes stop_codon:yes gene_type:complete
MGLKQDLIDAKKEGLRLSGATEEAIQQAENALDTQVQMEVDAILTFLTNCQFRITQLQSNVVLEDFKIPPQQADIQNTVTYVSPAGTPTPLTLPKSPAPSVLTKEINIGISGGGLESSGYAYIGRDPNSQEGFGSIISPDGSELPQTEVKLFREDIEDLL